MRQTYIKFPIKLFHNQDLAFREKMVLLEVHRLWNNSPMEICRASNTHFSEAIGLSKSRVSELLNKLYRSGYLNLENINYVGESGERLISMTPKTLEFWSDVDGGNK